MASDSKPDVSPQGSGSPSDGLTPVQRKRLQQCFERANSMMGQENYDYAITLLTTCVVGNPSDLHFAAVFLGCLKKKYNNNKKGDSLAFIKGASARRAVGKAESQKDWKGVIKAGVEALKLNPWDSSTLIKMAEASKELGNEDLELAYLVSALEGNPKDVAVCKRCAEAFTERKEFDKAIALWHRIEQIQPGNEEAQRAVAQLTVEKTIAHGGYEDGDPSKKKVGAKAGGPAQSDLSPIEKLQREIKRKPNEVPKYLELASLYVEAEDYDNAEETLRQAYEISGKNLDIRDKLEDTQFQNLKRQEAAAEKAFAETNSEEAKAQLKEIKRKVRLKDLDIWKNRCERYPNDLAFKYELGRRYQIVGQYKEAIAEFQTARNDPRRKGYCTLALAQCFQQIRQIPLAMSHYVAAIEEIPERDSERRNEAQYLAGRLAEHLGDLDTAEQHFTQVAQRNFAYKDIADRLDKIRKARENPEQ